MNLPLFGLHQFSLNKRDLYQKLKISRFWHDGKLQVCTGCSVLEALIVVHRFCFNIRRLQIREKNLLSYFFGTINARMSSSDKEQPVGFIPLRIQIIKNYAAFD